MTVYRYQALRDDGSQFVGRMEAQSLQHVLGALAREKLTVFDIAEDHGGFRTAFWPLNFFRWLPKTDWRAAFYRQLAVLLHAGISLDRALQTLAGQADKQAQKQLLGAIAERISAGQPLSAALKAASLRFENFETSMLMVGETTGSVLPNLNDLADTMERRGDIKSKITSALVYPVFLLALVPLSLILISTILVPNIAPLFESSSAPMPLMLRAMVAMHGLVASSPIATAMAFTLVAALLIWLGSRAATQNLLAFLAGKLPFFNQLQLASQSFQLCRLLGALLRSGAPLQVALSNIEATTTRPATKQALQRVREAVSAGQRLSLAFASEAILVRGTPEMISIGEETNQLPTMLTYAANAQEREYLALIDRLMTLLVPLLTVLMGVMVGGVMLSVMQAILSINQLATQ